ncbi:MAG: hypothetical protein E3K37_13635 [Candidatus Kuenenia sp.]|nr:hypothetical protein [Candidatus Kuenenia hertensis]
MLNKDQKRGLTIALRIMEETIQYIEQVFNNGDYSGILYDVKCSLDEGVTREILKRALLIKDKIKTLSKRFDLENELRDPAREILGKLSSSWCILEDVKAIKLKRYGAVADELEDVLDPHLNGIIDLILDIERLLLEKPS